MILLVVEYANGKVSKSTWEMVTAARELGREGPITALVLGSNVAPIAAEIARLKEKHARVVLFDAHSIRSRIPRLFDGELPQFNVGTNDGKSCDAALTDAVARTCAASGRSWVVDGRFKGGWTTRRYGDPDIGVHALQMELACRGYMIEPPAPPTPDTWPTPYTPEVAGPLRQMLTDILEACLSFARSPDR